MPVTLGVFEVREPLGRGGVGEVFRARWIGPGGQVDAAGARGVAIKVLSADRSRVAGFRQAFRREVRAAAGLNHPGAVTVLDYGEVGPEAAEASEGRLLQGSPWLAMELAEGGTLGARCASLGWSGLAPVLDALLDVLGHAHAHGIVHRDVKPENVLFGGWTPGPKLADFGLAHPLDDGGLRTARVGGTLAYMAPEQFDGDARELGPWTDLYALGCLAWRVVCGKAPYRAEGGFSAMARAHQTWPLPRLSPHGDVPAGLEAWLHCLLQKDPGRRFPLAADARSALRDLTAHGGSAERSEDRRSWALPSMPQAWGDEDEASPAPAGAGQLAGAGLGVFGLRSLPLVGRVEERERLWGALGAVHATGSPRALILEGPAGVGKSRLASWLCARAEATGAALSIRAHHGQQGASSDGLQAMAARTMRCVGLSRSLTRRRVSAWQEAALARSGRSPDLRSTLALTELVLPAPRLPGDAPTSLSSHGVESDMVALRSLLASASCDRPVVLWLDDVQWGQQALELVDFLLADSDTAALPVLAVLTLRTEALLEGSLEAATLARLRAADGLESVPVEPLAPHLRGPLVSSALGLRGDVAAQVSERSAGNPLFAIELVRDWAERGVLQASSAGFELRPGANLDMPHSLRDVWARRLDQLLRSRPASDRAALERAAVLGQRIGLAEWREACACTGQQLSPDLLPAILDARLGRVLGSDEGGGWAFAHGMLRETLELGARDAGRLVDHHAACAAMLARRESAAELHREGLRERLGRHLLASGSVVEAERCLAAGLQERLARGAYVLAEGVASAHRRALELLGAQLAVEDRIRADLLQGRLARARNRIGDALELCGRAEEAARAAGSDLLLAEACTSLALASYRAGDLDGCRRWSAAGRLAAGAAGSPSLAARCLEAEARALTDLGLLAAARVGFDEAARIHAELGDPRGSASSALGLAWLAWTRGQLDRASELIHQALETFRALDSPSQLGAALSLLGEVHRSRGELPRAAELYAQSLQEHRSCGSRVGAGIAQLNLALVHIGSEDWASARNAVHGVLGSMRGEGAEQFVAYAELMLLVCDAAQGRWEGWDERLDGVRSALRQRGQVHDDLAQLAARCAELAAAADRAPLAARALALAQDQLRGLGRDGGVSPES